MCPQINPSSEIGYILFREHFLQNTCSRSPLRRWLQRSRTPRGQPVGRQSGFARLHRWRPVAKPHVERRERPESTQRRFRIRSWHRIHFERRERGGGCQRRYRGKRSELVRGRIPRATLPLLIPPAKSLPADWRVHDPVGSGRVRRRTSGTGSVFIRL